MPLSVNVTLGLTTVETSVQVSASQTLIDPYQTGTTATVGPQAIREELPSQPGRGLLNLVDSLPGWFYEANGVLHPRESEYGVQFVVDGLPLTENRSPAFAAPFEAEEADSVRVRTAGYPAEYGRKVGGVVEVTTPKDAPSGFHGQAYADGCSFDSAAGLIDLSYTRRTNYFSASGSGFRTDRYLDPPVLGNYTNSGSSGTFAVSYARDLSNRDRIRGLSIETLLTSLFPTNYCNNWPASGRLVKIRRLRVRLITRERFPLTFCWACKAACAIPAHNCPRILLRRPSLPFNSADSVKVMFALSLRGIRAGMTGKLEQTPSSVRSTKHCST